MENSAIYSTVIWIRIFFWRSWRILYRKIYFNFNHARISSMNIFISLYENEMRGRTFRRQFPDDTYTKLYSSFCDSYMKYNNLKYTCIFTCFIFQIYLELQLLDVLGQKRMCELHVVKNTRVEALKHVPVIFNDIPPYTWVYMNLLEVVNWIPRFVLWNLIIQI
jgi:hypothetical protein